jgi:hypothetical protein
MAAHYRSYAEQAAHYFGRPHEGLPPGPVGGPAAWRAAKLDVASWRVALDAEQLAGFETALAAAEQSGKPLGELTRADFPLGHRLETDLAGWRRELSEGRGFVLLSGLPVERWGEEKASRFFWGFGLALGQPGAQNPQGDLLGHVVDTGEDRADPLVRLYRTRSDIAYHCDAADVVGLLCLETARRGGLSRLASSVAVFDELSRRRPDLAPRLFEPFALDLRSEERPGMRGWLPIPPCRYQAGVLRTFYHSDYFRSAARHSDAPKPSDDEQALLDLYEEIANSPEFRLDMALTPGDVQLVSNHSVIHARTAYEDAPGAGGRRHLLRLWLSLQAQRDRTSPLRPRGPGISADSGAAGRSSGRDGVRPPPGCPKLPRGWSRVAGG